MDVIQLRQSWYNALDQAQAHFRQLLTSSAAEWRRVVVANNDTPSSPSPKLKGKARASFHPELSDVSLHRKPTKFGDVYRIALDVLADEPVSLEPWKSVLMTPELRTHWDPAVEGAQLLEMFDPATRISKTDFTLGWPANPRDAVTISRSFNDATTLIDVSTSLPRSPDEPAYLRPSPPYVRSDVKLFAWCVQYLPSQPGLETKFGRLRITCFSQHDLRALWNIGSTSSVGQQLSTMVLGLFTTVKEYGPRVPTLRGYGNGVTIERIRFQVDRVALTVDYSVVPDEDDHPVHSSEGIDELQAVREARRLTRCIECVLPASAGWDVQLSTKASSELVEKLPWSARAIRDIASPTELSSVKELDKVVFQAKHSPLPDDHSILKVRVVIEKSGPSGLRLNGIPHKVETVEERDPVSFTVPHQMIQDATSAAHFSMQSVSTMSTTDNSIASSSSMSIKPQFARTYTERTAPANKSILSRVKRNYIYFSSLLQEPEAKWRQTTEVRGVSVTQLDSIDPTLVVYRAEATFVGIGIWDLYGAIVTPGARAQWDRQYDDAVLLEDVNELSELWHFKQKPIWPVNGRDAVLLKTVYKSPTTVHVFAFSADDPHLFPDIPPGEPNIIRTQVDLQGWAIEALSPTTTLVTLLEQSDPKGWSNKTSIPQQMITAVAGVGEFAIKFGGPPVATRLEGAKANSMRYDHEKGSFRIEYVSSTSRRATTSQDRNSTMPIIECELRCDLDTWASSLDIVVDPPPQSVTCLRRHRLSTGGGGLWITISHDAVFAGEERLQAIVRRGPLGVSKEKNLVMINGVKVGVDVEELPEHEVKSLSKQKRVKPSRIPLDQPPVMRVIRRRTAEWETEGEPNGTDSPAPTTPTAVSNAGLPSTLPKYSSPLGRFFTMAVEQATSTTQQAVAAISPATPNVDDVVPSSSKSPMQYALDALSYIQQHRSLASTEGWTLLNDKGVLVHRKMAPEISPTIPVHKGEKVIEGVSAEEVASVISSYDCQKQWDTRFDSANVFQVFRDGCHTAFVVNKGTFPFRDRGFYLASILARARPSRLKLRRNEGDPDPSNDSRTAIFCVSASFCPDSVSTFSAAKYNPYALPIGRVFVDGWILETLDPYTTENYAIPSTRCTRLVAVDYAGSIPVAVNSSINAALPRSILAVEAYMKGISPPPLTRLPMLGFAVLDKFDDQIPGSAWTVRKRDHDRLLVATEFSPQKRTYRSTIVITSATLAGITSLPDDSTPRPSRFLLGSSDASEISQPTPEDLFASTTTVTPRKESVSSFSGRSRSREALQPPTSMFTPRGEVRHPTDLLVAEVVVDSKLYPEGYDIKVRSRIRENAKYIVLPLTTDVETEHVLPVIVTLYTLPSSPLHSAGLNEDRPPRHLLRLLLPTAQYQSSTLQDPLTGEIRSPPQKPQWLVDLQDKGGAVVDVEIVPAAAGATNGSINVNGTPVPVVNEKASLTNLGRDELQDDRVAKADVLARVTGEVELPNEFQVPVAVAEHLLEPSALAALTIGDAEAESEDVTLEPEANQEPLGIMIPEAASGEAQTPLIRGGKLLGFFGSYPNPLSHFSTRASTPQSVSSSDISSTPKELPGRFGDSTQSLAATTKKDMYPLRVVLLVALIAFLIGSLLRSLLSPADFIYVVTDVRAAAEIESGWREIRRLVEVKYIVGGWDLQLAVVKRH